MTSESRTCQHELHEMETACVDGLCPLCLQGVIKRLRAALKPFADAAESVEPEVGQDYGLDGSSARYRLTAGHLRAARRALIGLRRDGPPYDAAYEQNKRR